jgi:hypothetical protein
MHSVSEAWVSLNPPLAKGENKKWIPASAGMTVEKDCHADQGSARNDRTNNLFSGFTLSTGMTAETEIAE